MDFDLGSPTTPFQDSPLAEAHHEEANDTNHGSGDHEAPVIQHNTTNPMNNNNNNSPSKFKVQLVPGADGDRASSYQETVTRDLSEGSPIKIGRFVAKDTPSGVRDSDSDRHIWFPSKVISRAHAEMWVRDGQVSIEGSEFSFQIRREIKTKLLIQRFKKNETGIRQRHWIFFGNLFKPHATQSARKSITTIFIETRRSITIRHGF